MKWLSNIPEGPRMEIGVLRGDTLIRIAQHSGKTYGVDSFEGMPEPTEHDIINGVNNYPKGRLAVSEGFVHRRLYLEGLTHSVELVRGFVPDVLSRLPDGPFALVHLDIDHYASTKAALEWLWPRMMKGGVLCCDDYFPDQQGLAALALNEWAATHPISGSEGRKCWWRMT